MRTRFLIICVLATSLCSHSASAQSILDDYIAVGLKNNLTIAEKNLSLDKAMVNLDIARSMYLPTVSFDAVYSTANGGRMIELPVGDLLNPVYQTLNQLTQSQAFPLINNERINFLPRNYYDARIRAGMPIINTDIKHNKHMNEQAVQMREHEVEIYQRELVRDIKIAYYNYWSAEDGVKVYQNALDLAKEGKRVNEKLLEAGSGLPAYVVRADAEIAQGEAKLVEAEQQVANARYYFNMLLNRDAEEPIQQQPTKVQNLTQQRGELQVEGREELEALSNQINVQETMVKMNKQVFVPKLNAFVDVGSQAENMRFNRESQYVMIGAQLTVPIFEGGRNKLKIRESQVAVAEAQQQRLRVQQQLETSARVANNEVTSTIRNYQNAKKQLEAAGTYQRLIQRGFNEGVNTYIETIDARSQYTNAQLAENLALYKWMIAVAKLERETASYTLD
ncbi:TolC family protein [Sphingobacterium corticibacter]|uniref:TolC family protein n=1 Tax=Sphingobacterium corticibacter TaxID=2171749 RepID=A0A2T8HGZ8_9SPHI|nr:TolC family protein [Sphingobacterium corticibacter]PVH24592.1 TolC family protein [Sphingobacterium corticibacter]